MHCDFLMKFFQKKLPCLTTMAELFLLCARQGVPTWRCKSSTHPTGGSVSRTARVPIVRWDLKEAAGKALARRTETV